jgi:iron complex outermembrane receptor protein
MRIISVLIFCISFIVNNLYGQNTFNISGKVIDERQRPISGATVRITSLQKGSITNNEGIYIINDIQKGILTIEVSFMGYHTFFDTISINRNKSLNFILKSKILVLHEVIINDNYSEYRKQNESLSIEIINNDYLKKNNGGSLMKTLERLPGISTIDIGSGQSKPVIRGLGFNRVVVLDNGVKHEGQQWGEDHGLEIDQYAVENIEVVKGPASLMYGSDAIGGVIDIRQNKVQKDSSISGVLDLFFKSGNNLLGSSFSIEGRKKWLNIGLRATLIDYGDYKVPTDSVDIYSYRAALYNNQLRNTAGKERNLHLNLGIILKNFNSKFYLSNVNNKKGFFANAHGLEPRNINQDLHDKSDRDILYPFQQVNHFKVINISEWLINKVKIEINTAFQRNFREEWSQYVSHGYMPAIFPDTLAFPSDLELMFDKFIYSGNIKSTLFINDKIFVSTGLSVDIQDNRIGGRGFIIPAFIQKNIGFFVFAKHSFSTKHIFQFGLRYDYGKLQTSIYKDWYSSPDETNSSYYYLQRADNLDRKFSNISWSAGYNYNIENLSVKINAGKSFRMPIAKELAANGVNYHHFSYEIGNPDLLPEYSYQLDAGIEYKRKKINLGITSFINYFSNYIYLNPGYEHDRLYGNGNQVYYYSQTEVIRYGGEISAQYQLTKSIKVGFLGEYVLSEQLSGAKKGFSLPFSPPNSVILNLTYEKPTFMFVNNFFISIDYKLVAAQSEIVPPEEITESHQLASLSFGGEVKIRKQTVKLSMQIQNLLNIKYFNHTSYYRLINVPEPGRNFILNISIPFSGKL